MDPGIAGRVAIAAASTSGPGRAVATALAAEGARVVVSGRRGDMAKEIAAGFPGAIGAGADLATLEGPRGGLVPTL
jgi:3-oxoacyl-[acyl-carrier protein] reductase